MSSVQLESFEQKGEEKETSYICNSNFVQLCLPTFFKVNFKGCLWLLLKKLIHSQMLNVLIETMTLPETC